MNNTTYIRRTTSTRDGDVVVYDAEHPESVFDTAGGRWVTVCPHGLLANHPTLALAKDFADDPGVWCETCAAPAVTEHKYTWSRRQLGRSPIRGGGTFYGVAAQCSCGWKTQVNQSASSGGEREARRQHHEHVKAVAASPRHFRWSFDRNDQILEGTKCERCDSNFPSEAYGSTEVVDTLTGEVLDSFFTCWQHGHDFPSNPWRYEELLAAPSSGYTSRLAAPEPEPTTTSTDWSEDALDAFRTALNLWIMFEWMTATGVRR